MPERYDVAIVGFDDSSAALQSSPQLTTMTNPASELTRLAGHRVEALLAIEPGVKIPSDAVASVEQSSLLGSNYLGVTFGTPGVELLKDGDEISTKATVDMSEVISQLGNLGSKLEQVVGEIGKSMGAGSDGGSAAGPGRSS